MLNPEHPAAILRHAWRNVRLDAIRAAATATIAELLALDRRAAAAHPARTWQPSTPLSAAEAALLTCCEELRHESGISDKPAEYRGTVPDAGWAAIYEAELDRYRTRAGRALNRLLNL